MKSRRVNPPMALNLALVDPALVEENERVETTAEDADLMLELGSILAEHNVTTRGDIEKGKGRMSVELDNNVTTPPVHAPRGSLTFRVDNGRATMTPSPATPGEMQRFKPLIRLAFAPVKE